MGFAIVVGVAGSRSSFKDSTCVGVHVAVPPMARSTFAACAGSFAGLIFGDIRHPLTKIVFPYPIYREVMLYKFHEAHDVKM